MDKPEDSSEHIELLQYYRMKLVIHSINFLGWGYRQFSGKITPELFGKHFEYVHKLLAEQEIKIALGELRIAESFIFISGNRYPLKSCDLELFKNMSKSALSFGDIQLAIDINLTLGKTVFISHLLKYLYDLGLPAHTFLQIISIHLIENEKVCVDDKVRNILAILNGYCPHYSLFNFPKTFRQAVFDTYESLLMSRSDLVIDSDNVNLVEEGFLKRDWLSIYNKKTGNTWLHILVSTGFLSTTIVKWCVENMSEHLINKENEQGKTALLLTIENFTPTVSRIINCASDDVYEGEQPPSDEVFNKINSMIDVIDLLVTHASTPHSIDYKFLLNEQISYFPKAAKGDKYFSISSFKQKSFISRLRAICERLQNLDNLGNRRILGYAINQ